MWLSVEKKKKSDTETGEEAYDISNSIPLNDF